jgi:putative transposase
VLNDLLQRGVQDVLVCCVDGLAGFPEAIEAVFPEAWVQTCIVHQSRSSMRYVAYKDRKRVRPRTQARLPGRQRRGRLGSARGARPHLGRALPDDRRELAGALGVHHPVPGAARRPAAGGLHDQQHRKPQPPDPKDDQRPAATFPDEGAATKLIYLAIQRAETKWRTAYNGSNALRGLKIHFGDRLHD